MKFFIDTSDVEEIKKAATYGWVDGVTTNPSLVAKSGKDFKTLIAEICDFVKGPVSAEVLATDSEGMIKEGEELAKIAKNVVIKLPLTLEGLKATKHFSEKGIQTNVTLCFQPVQALLAAKAGATMVSPFIGRLDDIGTPGMAMIGEIRQIFDNYGYDTEILAASIRHPMHILDAALIGADIATLPFKTINQLVKHPLTDSGLEQFIKDGAALNV
ncbi:MAG: fructose-6-phosphate aldolase [Bdellovibrionales bacterium]